MEGVSWGGKGRRPETKRKSVDESPPAFVNQPRTGGAWAKAGPAVTEYRSINERLKATNARLLKQLESNRAAATVENQSLVAEKSRLLGALQLEQQKQAALQTKIRSLRRKNLMLGAAQAGRQPSAQKMPRQMRGGTSVGVKVKTAAVVDHFLATRFATLAARQQALLEHYRRHPENFSLVINQNVSQTGFDQLAKLNPDWLVPHQNDILEEIQRFWTEDKALSIQIHCKVGHSHKYQDLIHVLGKTYNRRTEKWERKELGAKGSGLHVPVLPSCNKVNSLRAAIAAESPMMQNPDGSAAWVDMLQTLQESVRDERRNGYLKLRVHFSEDSIRVHFGGDAAQYYRKVKVSKFGFRLLSLDKLVLQAPQQARTIVQFEGKDDYEQNKEYLGPCIAVMDQLREKGMDVDGTHYSVVQSVGGDNVWLAEVAGTAGHVHSNGCCLCETLQKDYAELTVDETGRRVPVRFEPRTIDRMCAAAHRPLETGPDEVCPYCGVAFPDQETVDNLPAPENKSQELVYQTLHCGQRFGKPPLFLFSLEEWYLCILHMLLRLAAITFQRTVEVNLDTKGKVAAINELLGSLKLGVKKIVIRTKTTASAKDTEPINFIGR
jgi:hypothetical protein